MTQRELYEQVAAATGDDIETIHHVGFQPLDAIPCEERDTPLTVDWDLLAATR